MPKLVGTVTQGSNDAFAEASIVTGLTNLARAAWRIELIQFERNKTLVNADGANYQFCLARASKTAMPNITDRDVLFKWRTGVAFTTSGAQPQELISAFAPNSELLIVEDTIYFTIDSDSTSTTAVGYVSIEVTQKNISEAQRLAILASRIGS